MMYVRTKSYTIMVIPVKYERLLLLEKGLNACAMRMDAFVATNGQTSTRSTSDMKGKACGCTRHGQCPYTRGSKIPNLMLTRHAPSSLRVRRSRFHNHELEIKL